EGGDQYPVRRRGNQVSQAIAHFVRRAVGERHGEDLLRNHTGVYDEVRDAVCERARLAGAGPRDDEKLTTGDSGGGALIGIKASKRVEVQRQRRGGFAEDRISRTFNVPRVFFMSERGSRCQRRPGKRRVQTSG